MAKNAGANNISTASKQAVTLQEVSEGTGGSGKHRQKRGVFRGFSVTLLLSLAIALFFYFNFRTVIVSGHSMDPTFHTGQKLVACKAYWLVGDIKDNDVVVIQWTKPNEYIIKRVYKTAGETVDWPNAPADYKITQGEFRVPDGEIYVLGDNRAVSEDSRIFGPVPLGRVIGKIIKH
jgi:signal peptidase I